LGISVESFYNLDAVELYWAYKTWRETEETSHHGQYEVARFMGILVRNPKLLTRLREVLPFVWEKGKKARQTVSQMKQALMSIANAQGVSKTPLKKRIVKKETETKKKE